MGVQPRPRPEAVREPERIERRSRDQVAKRAAYRGQWRVKSCLKEFETKMRSYNRTRRGAVAIASLVPVPRAQAAQARAIHRRLRSAEKERMEQ